MLKKEKIKLDNARQKSQDMVYYKQEIVLLTSLQAFHAIVCVGDVDVLVLRLETGKEWTIVDCAEKIMLTVQEFSKISGIGEKRVRCLTHMDGFPAMRNGVKIMIHRERAAKWLADFACQSPGRSR